jgi:hypothetical protein
LGFKCWIWTSIAHDSKHLLDGCNINDNNSENKHKTLVETCFYHQYWGKRSFMLCFILMYYFSHKFWSHPKLISFMIKLQLLMLSPFSFVNNFIVEGLVVVVGFVCQEEWI